jgi:anti-sigma regulatory factor (Ser/Thr protein kinase)
VTETARSVSFCAHAILQSDLLIVEDARQHQGFRDNPFVVGEPHIRFYAGAPLVTPDGYAIGTLCVIDQVARTLSPSQRESLEALSRQAQAQLELRSSLIDLKAALQERDRAEAEQMKLIEELRASFNHVNKLTGLMPLCSACELNLVIPADPAHISTVTDGLTELLHRRHWEEDSVAAVELAVREALTNAIRHGCHNDSAKKLQCIVTCDNDGELGIVVRDPGPGFDPASVADPLAQENLLAAGGRGVFLINHLMDEAAFNDGGRELRMRKRKHGEDVAAT